MDVKEVQEKRKELERELFTLLNKFEQETGTHVDSISLEKTMTIGRRNPYTTDVMATILL